jgi:ribosomal protein S12 methylthiotransferase
MAIQQEISAELMAQKVGTVQRVIIDREEGNYRIGRTQYDSPEVDCEVLIENNGQWTKDKGQIGEFVDVKITKAEEFDLYGMLC